MSPFFIATYSAATLSIILLVAALLLLVFRKREPVTILFAMQIVADALWMAGNAAADLSTNLSMVVVTSGLTSIFGITAISLFVIFAYYFLYRRITPFVATATSLPLIFTIATAFSDLATQGAVFSQNAPTQTIAGPVYFFYLAYTLAGLIYSIAILLKNYPVALPVVQKQILYIVIGYSGILLGAATFSLLLPALGELRFFSVGPQFSLIFILATGYAISKHKLFDLSHFIQKTIIYTVLATIITLTYLAILNLFIILTPLADRGLFFATSITTSAIGIVSATRLEQYLRSRTNRFFYQAKFDYPASVQRLSTIIHEKLELTQLLSQLHDALSDICKPSQIIFVLVKENRIYSHDKKFVSFDAFQPFVKTGATIAKIPVNLRNVDRLNDESRAYLQEICEHTPTAIEYVIPITSGDQLVAAVLLGAKISDESYTARDFDLLGVFAKQFGSALIKAHLYEQLKDYSETLEQKVAQRTNEITAIHKEQDRMIQDISHGLQTPLTILRGELEILARNGFAKEKINQLEMATDRVSRFIRDLLRLSQLEMSEDIQMENVDLSRLVSNLLESFQIIADEQNINVSYSISHDLYVYGNPAKLEEAIANILSNAIKYMRPDGQRMIDISLVPDTTEITLNILDTGIGIPPEDIPHVFTRLHRSDNAKQSGVAGNGLGLAITKRIIDLHGGVIDVQSKIEKGTTFIIQLPRI